MKLEAVDKLYVNKIDILKEDYNYFPLNEVPINVFTNISRSRMWMFYKINVL